MAKVRKTRGCWLFATRSSVGYGHFLMGDGHSPRIYRAHRAAYELFIGTIPAGMNVLHTCDVRNCVNPAHLFLGTQADNVADMVRKQRHAHGPEFRAKLNPARGERAGNAKLTDAQVRAIRRSKKTLDQLAAQYGVHRQYVSSLRNFKYRKNA